VEKLTGAKLDEAVDQANAEGADIDPSARADDKRAALQEFYDQDQDQADQTDQTDQQEESTTMSESTETEQDESPQLTEEVEENDAKADRLAKHGEPSDEEKAAQQAAVVGSMRGQDRGPSQDDLNPAYATEFVTEEPDDAQPAPGEDDSED